jgi:hypothetical protein
MKDGLLEKIKSRGYWRVNFQPLACKVKIGTLQKCKEIVDRNSVELRGWDFPHIPRREDETSGTAFVGSFCEGWVDWEFYKEFWRMYKSGQFLCYLGLREDWFDEDGMRAEWSKKIKPGTSLGIISSVIYEITEIYEFLSRLAQAGLYDEGVQVSLSLYNTKDRVLWVEDQMRVPFMIPRKNSAPELVFLQTYTKDEIVINPKGLSNKMILDLTDKFGWNPTAEQIMTDQDKLLSRRI